MAGARPPAPPAAITQAKQGVKQSGVRMNVRGNLLAILVGALVPWLAVSMIGYWAAQPMPGSRWIELYSFMVSSLPTIGVSAIAACLLVFLGVRNARSYVLSYAAAIASLMVLMKPWSHGASHIAGVSAFWDQYIYMLVVPLLGLALVRNSLGAGARGAPGAKREKGRP